MRPAQLTAAQFRRFLGVLMVAGVFICAAQAHDLVPQSELRGRVVDPNHESIVGARISVTRKGQVDSSTLSNANGEFSISLEPGEYTLKIAADGFADATQIVRSKPSTFEPLEIVLQPAGQTATVTVTDMAGYEGFAISSATKTLTPLRDVPQSITVVSREAIKDQGMQSIADGIV